MAVRVREHVDAAASAKPRNPPRDRWVGLTVSAASLRAGLELADENPPARRR